MLPASVMDRLKARYGEPGRYYHTWRHVEAMLGWFDRYRSEISNPVAVAHAIYWHDAIYDARSKTNEADSADLYLKDGAELTTPVQAAFAHTLILATAGHFVPEGLTAEQSGDARLFLDFDLSILGAPEDVYDMYEANIRREYAFVPDEAYIAGRSAVLSAFLNRDRLYFSETGCGLWESTARSNLARALKRLGNAGA